MFMVYNKTVSSMVKQYHQLQHEARGSTQSSAEVKNSWRFLSAANRGLRPYGGILTPWYKTSLTLIEDFLYSIQTFVSDIHYSLRAGIALSIQLRATG
jgi:hypothetical protein